MSGSATSTASPRCAWGSPPALAAGKTASSLAALGFYLFDQDVFIYLLNFLVDGFLVAVALMLWSVTGRIGEPAAPS